MSSCVYRNDGLVQTIFSKIASLVSRFTSRVKFFDGVLSLMTIVIGVVSHLEIVKVGYLM